MKARVYVETSVVGYLTSWPSNDVVVSARQQLTREWWDTAGDRFELFVSTLVIREVGTGDETAAKERMLAIQSLPVLEIGQDAEAFAKLLIDGDAVPATEPEDALHIALAVANGVEYLVTWNFKHIANATLFGKIDRICVAAGYAPVIICSPEELPEAEK